MSFCSKNCISNPYYFNLLHLLQKYIKFFRNLLFLFSFFRNDDDGRRESPFL